MRVIAGRFQRFALATPKGQHTRPTGAKVREAMFNRFAPRIVDARFLDLFAGSGAMGIEALSRRARQAVFVEENRAALRCLEQNLAGIKSLGLDEQQTFVMRGDVMNVLTNLLRRGNKFDIIWSDPPYTEARQYVKRMGPMLAELLDEEGIWACEFPWYDIKAGGLDFGLEKLQLEQQIRYGDTAVVIFSPTVVPPLK